MTNRAKDDSGFTLVELLVVMAIISVLAGIAIPVFFGQRVKAFQAQMAADLHSAQVAETAWSVNNSGAYTIDLNALTAEGFRATNGITTHAKVVGSDYLACTKSPSVSTWLTYSSASGQTTTDPADCA